MKKLITVTIACLLLAGKMTNAQTNIFPSTGSAGIGTTTPDASSLLDMVSTTKGLLVPRMTKAQRDVIGSPATGLLIYQTTNTPGFYYYTGSAWIALKPSNATKKLDNLTAPTAVNVELLPGTDNTINIGSVANSWKDIYLDGAVFLGGNKFLAAIGTTNTALGIGTLSANTTGLKNIAIGTSALLNNTAGNSNVAIGNDAMLQNTTGSFNTAIGESALEVNTEGFGNIAIGHESLDANTTGNYNVAIGEDALGDNSTGDYNTACGADAMRQNATGMYNAAFGDNALYSNTTGYYNTAIGSDALFSNTTGSHNIAIGRYALVSSQQNSYNIAIGDSALFSYNHGGSVDHLTAVGYAALRSNVSGLNNTATGSHSLYTNTSGDGNTADGIRALYTNNGNGNTASGFEALYANTTGNDNTATGEYSLSNNTGGTNNTAAGAYALLGNTTGSLNTAFGRYTLFTNSTGTGNTAIGEGADVGAVNLVNATAIGRSALVAASNSLVLGSIAGVNTATSTVKVGIGTTTPLSRLHVRVNNASGVSPLAGTGMLLEDNTTTYLSILTPNASQNGIIFGNATSNQGGAIIFNSAANTNGLQFNAGGVTRMAITSAGNIGIGTNSPSFQLQLSSNSAAKPTSSSWTVASDARLKKDVKDFNDGLEVLNKIHPVRFSYTGEAGMPTDERGVGTLAQELQKVAPYMVKEWTYQNKNGEKENYLGVDYGAMDFLLLNSIKEQQKKIEDKEETIRNLQSAVGNLQNDNVNLQQQIEELKNTMKNFDNALSQCCISYEQKTNSANNPATDIATLEQNFPNPFNEQTVIHFYIPVSAKSAMIQISDASDKQLKSFSISERGSSQISISAGTLAAGVYTCQLIVDGKVVDAKKMTLMK